MQIRTIIDQIDLGSFALPEFQRGYVWNRDQVKGLVYSLYRRFPVGSLLTWVTTTEGAPARSGQKLSPGVVKLLLDGQQRVTTLYGLMRGRPPKFFQGNAQAFTGLYFNVETEAFEFYAATKMKDDPRWVSVTDLLQNNAAKAIRPFMGLPEFAGRLDTYLERLNALATIPDTRFHIEEVTGTDKSIDVVVEIFNRVNTGGTKLSKGDIALARVCSAWTGAREALRERLQRWARAGFSFELEWLLRSVTAQETDTAYYDGLATLDVDAFKAGLERTEKSVDYLLNVIASRLGLDHDRVLGGVYAFPLMLRYLRQQGTTSLDPRQRDRLLYWYVHTFLWGRYSGSTETVLNKDLAAIRPPDGSLEQLIAQLRQNRGDLSLTAEDFAGWSRGARFYPLLYMMTRTCRAVDWGTGIELSMHLLGRSSRLHIHHVFPKNRLRRANLSKADINAIANFTFLTQDTNIAISDRLPEEYLPEIAERYPNALQSHWIPADGALWKIGRYPEFLAARRELLAQAANRFLDELAGQAGAPPAEIPEVDVTTREVEYVAGGILSGDEAEVVAEVQSWIEAHGLPAGETAYELVSPETEMPIAILDLAWPAGLQPGLSSPVALLIDEDAETEEAASRAGFLFFRDVPGFRRYVRREILAIGSADDANGEEDEDGDGRRQLWLEYWTAFVADLEQRGSALRTPRPGRQRHIGFGFGVRGTRLSAVLPAASTPTRVQFTVYEPNRLQRYAALAGERDAIEGEIGAKLEWRELADKKESQVRQYLPEVDPRKKEDWPRQFAQLRTTLERFHRAFGNALARN